jgi:predicted TIM-barrel fold metal-dependent hydrolase
MPLDVPVLDAHVHFWDPRSTPRLVSPVVKLLGFDRRLLHSVSRRLFPKPIFSFVGKPDYVLDAYLPGDWHRDHAGYDAHGFIHVQADWHARGELGPAGETRWLESLCASDLRGIVAQARLESPELGRLLDEHRAHSPRFCGVRDMTAWDADPLVANFTSRENRMQNPAWQRGFALLGERGLTFDAWCYQPQLREFDALLRSGADTRVVLCHLGTPIGLGGPYAGHGETAQQRTRLAAQWHDDLSRLAEHRQLHVKISGLVMPIVGFGFHERPAPPSAAEIADKLGPHVEHALAAFGVERCLFASNFPMDKVSAPWTTIFEAFAALTASYDSAARRKLFCDNAREFYGVSPA